MTICAEYLTLSNSVSKEKRTVAEEARRYIEKNLDKKFGISDVCKNIGCSKSTLLTSFKREFGTTVNSFINEKRLERAEGLLYEGKKSIAQISRECGFSDQSYFSKVFSAKFGIPPTEYRAKREY
jgi:AraC-like DNA-binding protein